MRAIHKSIDKLFKVEAVDRPEELLFFLERLHETFHESHKGMTRKLILFALVWVASLAVREGVISGGEIASFKIERLELILLLTPLILGVIAYLLMGAMRAQWLLREALHRSYKHFLPTAYKLDLERMLAPPNMLFAEVLFAPRREKGLVKNISDSVAFMLALYVLVGPPLGILHSGYLAWSLDKFSLVYIAASVLTGMVFCARGLAFFLADYEMPNDEEDNSAGDRMPAGVIPAAQSSGNELRVADTPPNSGPEADT